MDPVYLNSKSHRVIEVVDCLADTVVSVTQLDRERGAKKRKWMLAAALACFLVGGASFFSAVGTASSNRAALHQHLAAGNPGHSFRPVRVSQGLEWAAGLSTLAGLSLVLGFFALRQKNRSQFLAEMPAEEAEATPTFEMVKVTDDSASFKIHPLMKVSLTSAEGIANDNEICAKGLAIRDAGGWLHCGLADDSKLSVQHGERRYHMSWTNRSNRQAMATGFRPDGRFASYVGVSAVMTLFLVAVLGMVSEDPKSLYTDRFAGIDRFIAVRSAPAEDPLLEVEKGDDGFTGETEMAESSEAGAKGTTGIESATLAEASMAIKKRSETPTMSRKQVRSIAAHSGILGSISDRQIFASFGSNTSFASGEGMQDWYGGINGGPAGHQVGELSGSWGNDVEGMGLWGTAKVGNKLPGLRYGKGSCSDVGPCVGDGATKMRRHVKSGPIVKIKNLQSSGGLDRSIIRRYIKKKKLRIQHCYERRLVVEPGLAGTLTTSFSIGGNGAVIGSRARGMQDEKLESCVAEVIAGIHFPSTDDSAVVNVTYPFTFQPAGE
jgi:hypothetical protein